jgi:hypothetical protein
MVRSSTTLEFEHRVRMTESERVDISEGDDGWSAECLVCHAWISTRNETRREAVEAFERHLRNDYPHNVDERTPDAHPNTPAPARV